MQKSNVKVRPSNYNTWNERPFEISASDRTSPVTLKRQFSSPSTTYPCQVLHSFVNIMSTNPVTWLLTMTMEMLLKLQLYCRIIFRASHPVGVGLFQYYVEAPQEKKVSSKIHKRQRRLHLVTYT